MRRRGVAIVAVAVLAAAGYWWFGREDREQIVVREPQVFNLLYDEERLRRVEPRAGELVRLRARRDGLELLVTVRPFTLPPYEGDVAAGALPVVAERRRDPLAARHPGFRLTDEGRGRVNEAPAYQLGFVADGDVEGREVWVVEGPAAREGLVVGFLRRGRPAGRRPLVKAAKSAFRSLRFGTDRG